MSEEGDDWAEVSDLHEFFDISTEEAKLIEECHKVGHGIEGHIYEYAVLHYAYQALTVCDLNDFMTKE